MRRRCAPGILSAAAIAARLHDAVCAFDAGDFHLGDFSEERCYDPQRCLLRVIESRWLPGCAFLTVVSPVIAEAFAFTYGLPTHSGAQCASPGSGAAKAHVLRRRATWPNPLLVLEDDRLG